MGLGMRARCMLKAGLEALVAPGLLCSFLSPIEAGYGSHSLFPRRECESFPTWEKRLLKTIYGQKPSYIRKICRLMGYRHRSAGRGRLQGLSFSRAFGVFESLVWRVGENALAEPERSLATPRVVG